METRPMTVGDLPAADELRRLVGWNQTPEAWQRLLSLEPHGCFVATRDDEVVGTVTTTTYGQTLAWIGMMLVHPEHQRHGIGTRLMQQALDYLRTRAVRCIKLDATPAGLPLYEKLGFVSEYTLTRHLREGECPRERIREPRPLSDADCTAIDQIDTTTFGASRSRVLRSLVEQSHCALVWPAEGPVRGFGLLRPGANADYLGPVVCDNIEGASALIAALLSPAKSPSVIWDIADQNAAFAKHFGFRPVRSLTRMRLGPPIASRPDWQFAIADPSLG
jgi:predicted N-acetyltransferase YhbS